MLPLCLAIEGLREILRKGYCGALHTHILASRGLALIISTATDPRRIGERNQSTGEQRQAVRVDFGWLPLNWSVRKPGCGRWQDFVAVVDLHLGDEFHSMS
jgi:hypothetical protein